MREPAPGMELRKLGGGAYLLPGSPCTLILPTRDVVVVIDPGYPRERAKQILEAISGMLEGAREAAILLTHSHSDHVAAVSDLASATSSKVLASRVEACAAEHPGLRGSLTFGGRPPEGFIHSLEAVPAPVDEAFSPPAELYGLEAIPTEGHSFGHVSFLTDRGILYAGDCVFGERLLRSVVVPYHADYASALNTLDRLSGMMDSLEKVVPSHGPVVSGGRAKRLVEANLDALEALPRRAAEATRGRPMPVEQIAARILLGGGARLSPSSITLACVTLRSMLGHLMELGRAEVRASEAGVLWRLEV